MDMGLKKVKTIHKILIKLSVYEEVKQNFFERLTPTLSASLYTFCKHLSSS